MADISQNLHHIYERIESAAQQSHETASGVSLIAVSKRKPISAIKALLKCGHRVFGENRVQEALEKYPPLKKAFPDIQLHMIGALQTNKVADAVALFDVIQTLDRPKLATALAKETKKQGRTPNFYIQVNIGMEPQKAGIGPDDVESFYKECQDAYGLRVEGLMCIPPIEDDPTPHFLKLKALAKKLGLPHISMGMSKDFEEAIACGATEVRVGTALFGARE